MQALGYLSITMHTYMSACYPVDSLALCSTRYLLYPCGVHCGQMGIGEWTCRSAHWWVGWVGGARLIVIEQHSSGSIIQLFVQKNIKRKQESNRIFLILSNQVILFICIGQLR